MHLRVFISSPGDVPDERTFAQQVVEQELPKDPWLRGILTCEAVRWDDPAAPATLPATLTPQAALQMGLARPSDCDVVVVILWSRLGTPLPRDMKRPDGSRYESGTVWEYEDAVNAARPPLVLVYRRKSKLQIDPDDEHAGEKNEQMERVRQFLKRFRNDDGSLRGGLVEYGSPQEFRDHLRVDLRNFLRRRLAEQTPHAERRRAPPPYGAIAKALSSGMLVPLVGPEAVQSGRAPGAQWDPSAPQFLPSGAELSRLLASELSFPFEADGEHLAEVASYYEVEHHRVGLRDRLRQFFGGGTAARGPIPALYQVLAAARGARLIITTNFDTQLERAFHAAGRPYDLIVYPADQKGLANAVLWWPHGATAPVKPAPTPNELVVNFETRTAIFKMHGTINPESDQWDGVVITESDNVQLLTRGDLAIPSAVALHVKDRCLLFLGFPLRDWSHRSILRGLKWGGSGAEPGEELQSWAVAEHHSDLELELWRSSKVFPVEQGLDDFAAQLREKVAP